MLRFPFSTRRSPDVDQQLRGRIAAAMQGITTFQSRTRIKDLRRAGRYIVSTHECDVKGDYRLWRNEREDKRVTTGFTLDNVSYRPATEREQARIGKAWVAFTTPCEGADLKEGLPFLVRTTSQVRAARMTTVGDREAAIHHFSFDKLLRLALRNRTMTTCATPRLYCRSRTDLHSFGQPVGPKPAVPPQDQIYWVPASPPKHG